jgi:penicillin V acylase-like amidase (Ntn superfamily)
MINNSRARLLLSVRIALVAAVLAISGLWTACSQACSEFILPVEETKGAVVSARTLEFPGVTKYYDVSWRAIEKNRNWTSGSKYLKSGELSGVGKKWTNKYGFVGLTALGWLQSLIGIVDIFGTGPMIMDGMNEKGLSASFLWLDGSELKPWYDIPKEEDKDKRLLWIHTVNYILGNFKTVAEVEEALSENNTDNNTAVLIRGVYTLDHYLGLHVVVHDSTGASMLIEWTNQTQHIYTKELADENGTEYGVVTNEPAWPTMVQTLSDYKNSKSTNEMKGLPADHTPKSRFAKLVKLRQFATMRASLPEYASFNVHDAAVHDAAVQDAAHLINAVDVVRGTDNPPGFWKDNFTGPVLIRDHVRKKLFFKGYNNQSFRQIDLARINFKRTGMWMNSLLADPNPDSLYFHVYTFSQDVTPLLAGSYLKGVAADMGQQTLNVTLSLSDEDLLNLPPAVKTGSMFIYAVTPCQEFFQWSGNRWTPVTNSLLTPAYTGGLAAQTFKVALDGLPASLEAQRGTKIYAGYGATSTEMFLANRQQLVHVIGDPGGDQGQ